MMVANPTPIQTATGDPTARTTEQLWREIEHANERNDVRFTGMDKAIELLQDIANKSPTVSVVNQTLQDFKDLANERFRSIQTQFEERDTAVNAALATVEKFGAKQNEFFSETMDKSEKSITKEIDAVKSRIDLNTKTTDDKIAALDKRMSEVNGHDKGVAASWGVILGAVGGIAGIGSIIGLIVMIARLP